MTENNKGINVLSLFDGISCGHVALDRCGIKVNNYYASEIDKNAEKISKYNYPNIIQLGDINKFNEWSIDFSKIDLIFAGFPCQSWSTAGKQEGDSDPRGALVHTLIDVWDKCRKKNNDVKFLFENVRMKRQFSDYIDNLFGVKNIEIDSSLVSGQSRRRLYWSNIEGITIPEDKNILLNDIVEGDYYSTRDKSYCIDANYAKGTNFRRFFFCGSRQLLLEKDYYPKNINKENANEVMHKDGNKWRKLNINELEKLQTLPGGYTSCTSFDNASKAIGNGFTVDIIAHILKGMDL